MSTAPSPAPLTIVGTGIAGYSLAREWRKRCPDAPLRLITSDDGASYYKPNLSKAFADGTDLAKLVTSTAAQMATQLKADIRSHAIVTRIDTAAHRIHLGDEVLDYSQLVLAVGADPIRLPIAGNAADRVRSVNDLADYTQFRDGIQAGTRMLIIGGGLIGCEFANDFAAGGVKVTVVDPMGWPMSRLLPEASGRAIERSLAGLGVDWRFGRTVKSLDAAGSALRAELSDGAIVETDVVLSAVGLRARTGLAKEAGIECKAGILVDSFLRTSAPDVYAIGDCIEVAGRVRPYVLPITHATRPLVATLCGEPTALKLPAMPVIVKTPACPLLVSPPEQELGCWTVTGEGIDLEAVFTSPEGNTIGFALTGAARSRRSALVPMLPAIFEPPASGS
jgi:rubredoxin-NAD+ reductase